MTTIRPPNWPTVPTRTTPTAPAQGAPGKVAAQKAFFEAALGRADGASAYAKAAQPKPAVNTFDEPPTRILRPGSLLDIKV